jgi:hypothetical protein
MPQNSIYLKLKFIYGYGFPGCHLRQKASNRKIKRSIRFYGAVGMNRMCGGAGGTLKGVF